MRWVQANDLDHWADTIGSRPALSELVSALVRASATEIGAFRFPTGDSAQIPGYDGRLVAKGAPPYVPDGESVWEFGTEQDYFKKANKDYEARSTKPRGVEPAETTFVFVTPRTWRRDSPSLKEWEAEKKAAGAWRDVRVIDGVALEDWLDQHPPVAARAAREILRVAPQSGARSTDEFWEEFASGFKPTLTEKVLLCGRTRQAQQLLRQLIETPQVHLWQADSPEEVLAFAVAAIRSADPDERKFLEARTLVLDGVDAARLLARRPNLALLARSDVRDLCGMLAQYHPVIFPLGREASNRQSSTILDRPTSHELSEALESMGLAPDRLANLPDNALAV